MAFNTYVKIEDTILPLPDSFELSYSNREAESSGETEAGTVQRDIVRSGVVSIDAAYSLSRKYLPVLSTYSKMPRLKVSYFDPDLMELKKTSMYMENYKVKLVKDTSYQSLWEVSFTLKEY